MFPGMNKDVHGSVIYNRKTVQLIQTIENYSAFKNHIWMGNWMKVVKKVETSSYKIK